MSKQASKQLFFFSFPNILFLFLINANALLDLCQTLCEYNEPPQSIEDIEWTEEHRKKEKNAMLKTDKITYDIPSTDSYHR